MNASKREWQSGDVARVVGVGVVIAGDDGYWYSAAGRLNTPWRPMSGRMLFQYLRPLAVIDYEDREQVERLLESLCGMSFAAHACGAFTCLQAALREFANPTPKVEEPLGLGAVVEDDKGLLWIRQGDDRLGSPWYRRNSPGAAQQRCWAEIKAVRVLSEGVAVRG